MSWMDVYRQRVTTAEDAVSRSLAWYQAWRAGADMHRYTLDEISEFTASS